MTPGCGKPTWNGKPNEYCSKLCKDTGPAAAAPALSCARPGCGKPTFNGQPNEFCSRGCSRGAPPATPTLPADANFEEVKDKGVFGDMQRLLESTHKTTNNWTRDRGCRKHGHPGHPRCSDDCRNANQAPVPRRYKLEKVFRNINDALWTNYSQERDSIVSSKIKEYPVCTSQWEKKAGGIEWYVQNKGFPKLAGCNEWYLFHGASEQACRGICASNFLISKSGTGATYKKRPLYGWGLYFAERSTKADEYVHEDTNGVCTMLVCRVVGGNALQWTGGQTDGITEGELRKLVFTTDEKSKHHSVVGDRESAGKPYNEIIVYTPDQVFPEFMLQYRREV